MLFNWLRCMVFFSVIMCLKAAWAGITANPADDPHLVIWYKLDETEGGTARDNSKYGRDAVVDGPGNLGVWNPGDGQFGGSLIFNDNTDIEVPIDALSTISTGITVSVWLKDASRPGSNNWVFGTGSGDVRVNAAVVASNGDVLWRAGNSSNDQLRWDLDGVDHTTIEGWHHWVFVKDEVNGVISIYLDGILAASKSGVDSTLVNVPGSQLRFGVGAGHANDFIGMMDDIRVYDLALTAGEVQLLYTGVFGTAVSPDPADKAEDIRHDVTLSWTPGKYADKHDVYFGTNFDDVNDADRTNPLDVLVGQNQDANSYSPDELLQFGQTYYWRIDEVNAPPDFTVFKGGIWSFTAEPFVYPVENITATASSSNVNEGPENTVNGSGLDESGLLHSDESKNNMWLSSVIGAQPTWIEYEFDKVYKLHEMWVWNFNESWEPTIGAGLKDVTIGYSTGGTDYTTLGTTHEFARAPGTPGYAHNTTVDLSDVTAKYVRLTANNNWGGILPQYGLSEVRLFYIPIRAREPRPDSGATDMNVDVILGFRAGREAALHDMYFSTDEQAVIDGTAAVTTMIETSYGPLSLDLGKTYYWRIDEVNEAETPNVWQGELWYFTTTDHIVVDDFERYNDLNPEDPASNRIFLTWIDGWQVPTNGSIVGYEMPPFCEQTIVNGGRQSMPLFYDNTGTAAYSEAERTFAVGQNWTQAGAATLVLYFYGTEGSTGQLYVKVDGSKVVYDGDAGDIAKVEWKQWNIDLASLGVDLQNVTKLAIGIDGNGASGTLYVDDIRLYVSAPEPKVN